MIRKMLSSIATRALAGMLLTATLSAAKPLPPREPAPVRATLSEWAVELSQSTVPAGPVTFTITNSGTIPHAFEVEGRGIERETKLIQPGQTDTMTLDLKVGMFEVYCPVGKDSHKKLGMDTHLKVVNATAGASPMMAPGVGAIAPAKSMSSLRAEVPSSRSFPARSRSPTALDLSCNRSERSMKRSRGRSRMDRIRTTLRRSAARSRSPRGISGR